MFPSRNVRLGCSLCVSKWKAVSNKIGKVTSTPKPSLRNFAAEENVRLCSSLPLNSNNGKNFNNSSLSRRLIVSAVLTGGLVAATGFPQRHQAHGFWPKRLFGHEAPKTEEVTEPEQLLKVDDEKVDLMETAVHAPLKECWKDSKITLYQYQNCPFCSKVRSFLNAYDVPFEIVEVHPFSRKEISFSEYKKVPLVTIEQDGVVHQINDSSVIISAMASYMIDDTRPLADIVKNFAEVTETKLDGKEVKVIPNKNYLFIDEHLLTPVKERALKKETKWREWTDSYFIHLISPNLYRSLGESYNACSYHISLGQLNGTWAGVVGKYFGPFGMWMIGKAVKKKYNVSSDVRQDLYAACQRITMGLGTKKFLGGDEPNLADISLYGIMSIMENQQVFADLEKNTKVMKWYKRTKRMVEKHNMQDLRSNLVYRRKVDKIKQKKPTVQ